MGIGGHPPIQIIIVLIFCNLSLSVKLFVSKTTLVQDVLLPLHNRSVQVLLAGTQPNPQIFFGSSHGSISDTIINTIIDTIIFTISDTIIKTLTNQLLYHNL